jgi:hypothetical protein
MQIIRRLINSHGTCRLRSFRETKPDKRLPMGDGSRFRRSTFALVKKSVVVSSETIDAGWNATAEVAEWAMSYHGAGDGCSGGCWADARWISIRSAPTSATAGKRSTSSRMTREKETGGRGRNGAYGSGGSRRSRHERRGAVAKMKHRQALGIARLVPDATARTRHAKPPGA